MSTKDLIIFISITAVGYLGYRKVMEKSIAANKIIATGNFGATKSKEAAKKELMLFDKDFVVTWAKAVRSGNTEFNYRGKIFLTKGGRAKQ